MITQKDNLIFQSFYTSYLIAELGKNKFINSAFFKKMNFDHPKIKEELVKIGVGNQGSLLMVLYALLVIPKELLEGKFGEEYSSINNYLSETSIVEISTYPSDKGNINFIRHIRNAVAHARVEFIPKEFVIFQDKGKERDKNTNLRIGCDFKMKLPLNVCLGLFIEKLTEVHKKYHNELSQNPENCC